MVEDLVISETIHVLTLSSHTKFGASLTLVFCLSWKEGIDTFKHAQQQCIEDNIPHDSVYKQLTIASLQTSCSWIEGVCKFLTDAYLEYANTSFGKDKA